MTNPEQAAVAALLLRLALGVMFLAHAWVKVRVFTPSGTAQFFKSLGLPGELAYLTMAAEIVRYASSPGRPSDLKNWAVPEGVNTLTFTQAWARNITPRARRRSKAATAACSGFVIGNSPREWNRDYLMPIPSRE